MPHLDINFDSTPDEHLPMPNGIYPLTIKDCDVKPAKSGKGLVLHLTFTTEFEGKERQLRDWIVAHDEIKIKQLCVACDRVVGAEGLDTEDLLGDTLSAQVSIRTYVDDDGETKEANQIKNYCWKKGKQAVEPEIEEGATPASFE